MSHIEIFAFAMRVGVFIPVNKGWRYIHFLKTFVIRRKKLWELHNQLSNRPKHVFRPSVRPSKNRSLLKIHLVI